jgi:hypothetical protein
VRDSSPLSFCFGGKKAGRQKRKESSDESPHSKGSQAAKQKKAAMNRRTPKGAKRTG